jgi:hypothetical protein
MLLLQLGGLGWEGYWKNNWNKFDLLLLVSSVVDMIVALAMGEAHGDADGDADFALAQVAQHCN